MYEIIDSYGRVYGHYDDLDMAFLARDEINAELVIEFGGPVFVIETELMREIS